MVKQDGGVRHCSNRNVDDPWQQSCRYLFTYTSIDLIILDEKEFRI